MVPGLSCLNLTGGYCLLGEGYALWAHEDDVRSLVDYKFFCFNGKAKFLYISRGLEDHKTAEISFYDLNANELPFHRSDYKPLHNAAIPGTFEKMIKVANVLAESIDSAFVRIDLYSIVDEVFFSEITFSPCGGFLPFYPETADGLMGKYLIIE